MPARHAGLNCECQHNKGHKRQYRKHVEDSHKPIHVGFDRWSDNCAGDRRKRSEEDKTEEWDDCYCIRERERDTYQDQTTAECGEDVGQLLEDGGYPRGWLKSRWLGSRNLESQVR